MKDKLKIMITGAGAPQSPTLIRHLVENGERPVSVVGIDMDKEASGSFLADAFHVIPAAGSEGYFDRLFEVIRLEKPDALLNVSGADVRFISRVKDEIEAEGTACICSSAETIEVADNKYTLFQTVSRIDPSYVPEYYWPKTLDEFVETARKMGYPDRDVCFKPHVGKGSRGFRVLTERFSKRDLLLNHKPISRYMSLDEFVTIFRNEPDFPTLMLMEVASGEEIDAMTIGYRGEALLSTYKTRESDRWGIIDKGELVRRPEIGRRIEQIISAIPLEFNISLQFIGGKIIEINPRTSTFIYAPDFNEPWLAVQLALGLIGPDDVRAAEARVPYGRRMVRHMDQIFHEADGRWWR